MKQQTIEEIKKMAAKNIPRSRWNGVFYHALPPQSDSEDLAALGRRLVVWHGSATQPQTTIDFVPKLMLHSGTVIGIVD